MASALIWALKKKRRRRRKAPYPETLFWNHVCPQSLVIPGHTSGLCTGGCGGRGSSGDEAGGWQGGGCPASLHHRRPNRPKPLESAHSTHTTNTSYPHATNGWLHCYPHFLSLTCPPICELFVTSFPLQRGSGCSANSHLIKNKPL